MRTALLLVALALIASTAGAQIFAETDDTPTPEVQCETLCRRVYTEDKAKIDLCLEGCAQAAACTADCDKRFADDEDKRGRCNYRCARAR